MPVIAAGQNQVAQRPGSQPRIQRIHGFCPDGNTRERRESLRYVVAAFR